MSISFTCCVCVLFFFVTQSFVTQLFAVQKIKYSHICDKNKQKYPFSCIGEHISHRQIKIYVTYVTPNEIQMKLNSN